MSFGKRDSKPTTQISTINSHISIINYVREKKNAEQKRRTLLANVEIQQESDIKTGLRQRELLLFKIGYLCTKIGAR